MKLYYTRGACSLSVRILINEMDLACEYISVDLKTKHTEHGEDYLKINPKGAVPALITNNAAILTENIVIHQYLADTNNANQLLPPVGNFMRYRVLEWSNYISTEIHKSYGSLFNPMLPQEIKDRYFINLLKNKFSYVDKCLENKNYLLEEHFTLPDAYLFVTLLWTRHFKFDLTTWPNLNRYFLGLQKRKAIQQSLKEEELEKIIS